MTAYWGSIQQQQQQQQYHSSTIVVQARCIKPLLTSDH